MAEGFKDFCGNVSFWDQDLLLNSSWPHFTDCFQQTALPWIPCTFMWIAAIFYLRYLHHLSTDASRKISFLSIAKGICILVLCLLILVQLIKEGSWHGLSSPASLYLAYGLMAITYAYAAVLLHLERRRGLVTSGVQFTFWSLVLLTNIIPLYTNIIQKEYDTDVYGFSLVIVHFSLILVVFILQFFSEAPASAFQQKDIPPITIASIPNLILFWWTNRMMTTGYKRPLTAADLFPLEPNNQAKNIIPNFRRSWSSEVERVRHINQKRQLKSKVVRSQGGEKAKDENVPLMSTEDTMFQTSFSNSTSGHSIKPTSNVNGVSKENVLIASQNKLNDVLSAPGSNQRNLSQLELGADEETISLRFADETDNEESHTPIQPVQETLTQNYYLKSSGTLSPINKTSSKTPSSLESYELIVLPPNQKQPSNNYHASAPYNKKEHPSGSDNNVDSTNANKVNGFNKSAIVDNSVGKDNTSSKKTDKTGGKKGSTAFLKKSEDKHLIRTSLLRVIAAIFWRPFLLCQFLYLITHLIQFVNPLVLNTLLHYVSNRSDYQPWTGYILASCFFVVSVSHTIINEHAWHLLQRLSMRIRSALVSAVYEKALTMSQQSRREATIGEIVNLMSIDTQRIQDAPVQLFVVWTGPLTIAIALYQLWGILGIASLAGLGVLVLAVPVNALLIRRLRGLHITNMFLKDRRIKLMAQVLSGIKVLKLYAWEKSFEDKILEIRNQELKNLKQAAICSGGSIFMWTLVPYLVTLASFTAYILESDSNYLDPAKAFVSLALFNLMRFPINSLPAVVPAIIQASVSMNRINTYLNWEDIDPDNVKKDPQAVCAISIENGTFTWDLTFPRYTLQNINVFVPEGKLIAIVGPVGCGKSSLLSAMLGEMNKVSGLVTVKNSIAYVPQEAWIQNATVRDNILFGQKMSQRRYNQVIKACALESDLEILVGGDMTEIGEKGINLSGGQRQRVSLARAIYSAADTYLLDDPLSAVDSHVGKHIFQQVIGDQGILAHKTRILVTHGVHWLPMTDLIVVINEGSISEIGTYEQLLAKDGAFAEFLKTYLATNEESDNEDEKDEDIAVMKNQIRQRLASFTSTETCYGDEQSKELNIKRRLLQEQNSISASQRSLDAVQKAKEKEKQDAWKLIMEEESMTGKVHISVYMMYIKALGGLGWLGILLWYIVYQASALSSNVWLSHWTDDPVLANTSLLNTPEYNERNAMYLGVYGALGVAQAVFILGYNMMSNLRMVRAAGSLHAGMLSTILKSPMAFFETTPIGRIIGRLARDVDICDGGLPLSFRQTINSTGNLISTIILIAYSSPIFLAVIVPLAVLYKLVQNFYVNSSRQLRRLDSTTRSPVYSHFTETIQGAMSIRAYGSNTRFINESQERVDKNLVCYYAIFITHKWLCIRLQALGSLITLSAALFSVIKEDVSSGLVGLSVTYAMNITGSMTQLVMSSSDLESNIVSAERIKEYSERETEAAWKGPNIPSDKWPEEGSVEFKDYKTRYRPGLELVIRGLSCSIKGGEKVGIVGRTGAGKSSLTLALFRLIEAAEGSIVIDGERIADIGLHDLRGRLTILPQDAFVFSGTLRMNIDPNDKHSDDEIWNALDHAHLSSFVRELPGQLSYECGESGQNLSVGQRQLICLARSLLRKSKILVLDEATAAVDMETDDLIQQTIRSEFKGSTVLTIAHRLNTILDYDRIMVMEQGVIKEFAPPSELLSNPSSHFYGMAKAAGLV